MNVKRMCSILPRLVSPPPKPSTSAFRLPHQQISSSSSSSALVSSSKLLSSSLQQLQKLASVSTWMCVAHPRYHIFSTQALRLSTSASPLTDKDGSSDSPVEETSASSGEEVVDPVIQGKHEDASGKIEEELTGKPESSVKGEEEQSTKPNKEEEEEEDEAIARSIALIESLIAEKEGQLDDLRERAVSSKAELDSVRTRLQRESDNSKKFAIQGFSKSLLDVADNLGRALMTVPEDVRKSLATDQSEIGRLLQSLLEGLMLTERELMKVFKKFGVEKFEPVGEQFDPNSHLALFEMPDPSKEPGTVAAVVKVGYMLHERVLRPAEVGVVKSLD